jgi:hypothetical protein
MAQVNERERDVTPTARIVDPRFVLLLADRNEKK